jgi:hypothetical protein
MPKFRKCLTPSRFCVEICSMFFVVSSPHCTCRGVLLQRALNLLKRVLFSILTAAVKSHRMINAKTTSLVSIGPSNFITVVSHFAHVCWIIVVSLDWK